METDYRDLLDEIRRLRRERDDLAKMCRRLAEELAAATFGGRLEPAPECACGNGAATVTVGALKGETVQVCAECAKPEPC